MKIKLTALLTVLLFITCSKENNNQTSTAVTQGKSSQANSPEDVPLNDLGTGLYKGYIGGLYPDGSNKPSGVYANDLLATCQGIVPLDMSGQPAPKGYVVFISMGASTGGKNMTALIQKTRGNPATYSRLKVMNCNQPAQKATLTNIMIPNSPYWGHVSSVLKQHSTTYSQVQVVYLETDDGLIINDWPERPKMVRDKLEACLRTMKNKFANLKVVYVLARTRTFNDNADWHTEPNPYYFGWGCKWAIQDQINGVPGTQYKGSNPVAPMLAWGFYQWADSLPRKTDNFYWRWSETKDGLHANEVGQDTLSSRFQKFLLTDPYAKLWYAAH